MNGEAPNPEYFSNSFGGQWSDSVNMEPGVAQSTRISGTWGDSVAGGLTALFKLFDQSQTSYLVELGWVTLDESKLFSSTNRDDVEHLTWPFDHSWSVPGSEFAPYRCYYDIPSPASSDKLKFHLFDPVLTVFNEMSYQPGQSPAEVVPSLDVERAQTSDF